MQMSGEVQAMQQVDLMCREVPRVALGCARVASGSFVFGLRLKVQKKTTRSR